MRTNIILTSIIHVCSLLPSSSELDITMSRCTSSGVPIKLPRIVNADLMKAWKTFMRSNQGAQFKHLRIYKENGAFCIDGTALLVDGSEFTG